MIKFDVAPEEAFLIEKIVDRYESIFNQLFPSQTFDRVSASMDVTATHRNGCPLRLRELLESDLENFAHDIGGIAYHLNRETGQLLDCFLPRFYDYSADEKNDVGCRSENQGIN